MPLPGPPESFLHKRTLIVGDVNSGKTTLTQEILDAFCREGVGGSILVLDLAPRIPPEIAARKGLSGVGGSLSPPAVSRLRYLRPTLLPPRLMSQTQDEAVELARRNLETIEQLMGRSHLESETVFLNDVSIYLQAGSARKLLSWLEAFRTVVANGYMGERLGGGPLSRRERQQMEELASGFDAVIRLGASTEIRGGGAQLQQ